jgi:hypothetical protein
VSKAGSSSLTEFVEEIIFEKALNGAVALASSLKLL